MASTDRKAFEAVFPSLAEDLLAHARKYNLPGNAMEWFEKVCLFPRDRRIKEDYTDGGLM